MDGPKLSVRSLRPIKEDEELFISYIDVTNPFARRQHELKSRYFFQCSCSKCRKGPTLQEDAFSLPAEELSKDWSEVIEEKVIPANPDLGNDPANYVGDDEASKKVAVLQAMVFKSLDKARASSDPKEAISMLEKGITICHETKLWPLYRQPYPALRHELFVSLLTAGDYTAAFVHATQTVLAIDPKLFPKKYHPVRVVHAWTLAMLIIYLASEPDNPLLGTLKENGVDFGALLYGVLSNVKTSVRLSHGESSRFAQMVERKWEEVWQLAGEMEQSKHDLLESDLVDDAKLCAQIAAVLNYEAE